MIYVIKAAGTEYIKVGVADDPVSRMRRELQTGCPHVLVLLAVADWPDSSERRIHRCLKAQHVRGEWFKHDEVVESLIKSMQSGVNRPEPWLCTLQAPRRLARVLSIAR